MGRSANRIFWEVADEAQQTRSRIRLRQGLTRLAERQTDEYERLGRMGFQLLHDGVAVQRTPETSKVLAEIDRLQTEQRQLVGQGDANLIDTPAPFPWRRVERTLQSGQWVIHVAALSDLSPWCGRPMAAGHPPGLCVALTRDHSIRPVTPGTIFAAGDVLNILAPADSVSDWDRWLAHGLWAQPGDDS